MQNNDADDLEVFDLWVDQGQVSHPWMEQLIRRLRSLHQTVFSDMDSQTRGQDSDQAQAEARQRSQRQLHVVSADRPTVSGSVATSTPATSTPASSTPASSTPASS